MIKSFTYKQLREDPTLTDGLVFLSRDSEGRTENWTVPESVVTVAGAAQSKPVSLSHAKAPAKKRAKK